MKFVNNIAEFNRALKNIIFDIDGTITENGQPISKEIESLIEVILSKGINVILATARPLRDTLPLLPQKHHELPIIGCNGAMISRYSKVQSAKKIPKNTVNLVKNYLDEMKVPYVIDGLYGYAISSEHSDFHSYIQNKLGSKPMIYEELELQGITKILLLKFDLFLKSELEKIIGNEENKLTMHHHKLEGFVDLVAENTNKFYAAIEMGIDLSCTAVFGNDFNDIMLLKNAYLPYIVGSQLDAHVDFPHIKIESVSAIPKMVSKLINGS
ncbi:MAG: HAD family phosphatase [Proteobacteria bacterium]|nr:HAD family phosphatase [Pseudomonadota bacterium]